MAHVAGDKIDESSEWSVVVPEEDTKIPEFGMEPAEAEPTEEEAAAERDRLAAEAAAGTPEAIEAVRLEKERLAAAGGKTPEEIAAEKETTDKAAEREKIRKEMLAEMGFESVEEIKKLKEPAVAETPEEKAKRLEKQEASFHQYAVTNDKMSLLDINTYQRLNSVPPNDLVLADFTNEYKDANKDRQEGGKPDPVTDEEITEAFETAYNLNSENPLLKKAGERALAARAKEILAEPKAKYESAKEEYEGLMERKAKMPEFKAFIQGAITSAIPPKFEFEVDGRPFSVELDGADFKEIEQKFKDDEIFAKFFDTKDRQGLKGSITNEAQRQLADKYYKKIAEVANKAGYSAGLKDGKVGAKAPFTPEGRATVVVPNGKLTEEEKANIRQGIGQY